MSAGVQMGPNAVTNPQALVSALGAQQPPPNPSTPAERLNPDQQVLEHIKSAQVSLDRARNYTNDPLVISGLDTISGSLTKLLMKFDGSAFLQSLIEAVQTLPPLLASAAGGQQPAMGVPPMGGPPPMAAPTSGVPGPPGAPL